MQILYKILVHIPSITAQSYSRSALADSVCTYAETQIACFEESGTERQNILFAEDNPERFIGELIKVRERADEKIEHAFEGVKKVIGADELGAIADIIRGYEIRDDVLQEEVKKVWLAEYLMRIAKLLYGEFDKDLGFFNTLDDTADIYNVDIDDIRHNPADWALVLLKPISVFTEKL